MRIQIVTSCTGKKRYTPANQLKQVDFQQLHDKHAFAEVENNLAKFCFPAIEMYTGHQHICLLEGMDTFQVKQPGSQIELWILSAGYGLIPATQPIVPYECTFQDMTAREIRDWASFLHIPQSARNVFHQHYDLLIVLLGEKYLRSLGLDADVAFASPTLFISSHSGRKFIRGKGQVKVISFSLLDTKRFSCGMVGLKGEITKRMLVFIAEGNPTSLLFSSASNEILTFLEQVK